MKFTEYYHQTGYTLEKIFYRLLEGKEVWIQFNNPRETRRGSIGRLICPKLSKTVLRDIAAEKAVHVAWVNHALRTAFEIIHVEFPDTTSRPITINTRTLKWKHVEWLDTYSGPAVRMNTPVKIEVAEFKDKFGIVAKVGDFIGFIHHGDMKFGTITRFGSKESSQIHFQTIDNWASYFIAGPSNFAIIDKDFRNRMMIHKLTN